MPKTLDQLEAAEQAAQQRHEAAQQAATAARQRADTERADRLDTHDRQLLDSYDDEKLGQQVRDAQRALDQAVAADPLGAAWVQLKQAQLRRAHAAAEAAGLAARLGDQRTIVPRAANSAVFEEIGKAVDRLAERAMADEFDAHDDERTAAGEG